MKSTKADSYSDILSDPMTKIDYIDYLVRENRLIWSENKCIKNQLAVGQVIFDPRQSLSLSPNVLATRVNSVATRQQQDCYNKSEGNYNKSER